MVSSTKQSSQPTKNHHFRVWLQHAEPKHLNQLIVKKLDREELFLLLAFCFGFSPQDEVAEKLWLKTFKNSMAGPLLHFAIVFSCLIKRIIIMIVQ